MTIVQLSVSRHVEHLKRGNFRITIDYAQAESSPLHKTYCASVVIGAQRRLALLGNKVELEYGQSIDRLFRETIRMILIGLGSAETAAAPAPGKRPKAGKGTAKKRSS